jgi:hypothetical protein
LHEGLPKIEETFKYVLCETGLPIEREKGIFKINAFALRDRLLIEIEGSLKKWKAYHVSLPETYEVSKY